MRNQAAEFEVQQELPELNSNYPTLNQEEIDLHADLDTCSLSLDAEIHSSVPAQSESAEVHSLSVGKVTMVIH